MTQIAITGYSRELQGQLFPDNAFYKNSVSEVGIAADAETFEIPNLSALGEAKEGKPTILPLKVEYSEDTKTTGAMKLFYANPLLITDVEEVVTNYNKRQNKQLQQAGVINMKVADYAAYQWMPTGAANIVVSTGSARGSNVVGLSATRKAVTKADILNVYKRFLLQNVSTVPGEMYGLLTPDAHADLLNFFDVDFLKSGNEEMIRKGVVGMLYGIKFMVRSQNGHIGALYAANGTRLRSVTTADTDRPTSLFWHSGMVCHAEANAKTYVNEDDATYLGTIISSSVRFGAEKNRNDEAGVVTLCEVA